LHDIHDDTIWLDDVSELGAFIKNLAASRKQRTIWTNARAADTYMYLSFPKNDIPMKISGLARRINAGNQQLLRSSDFKDEEENQGVGENHGLQYATPSRVKIISSPEASQKNNGKPDNTLRMIFKDFSTPPEEKKVTKKIASQFPKISLFLRAVKYEAGSRYLNEMHLSSKG